MAEIEHSPTLRRRRLSAELRRLREVSGLTAEEVSRRLEWSRGKLTHIERAQWRRPSPRDVRDLLEVYGVADPERREALIVLAREARERGWWSAYHDLLKGPYVDLENEASTIRAYRALTVPGLLQTRDYAAAVIAAGSAAFPGIDAGAPAAATEAEAVAARAREHERRVELRMRRQRILARDRPPRLSLIIDEAALLRGSATMPEQLRQIAQMVGASHESAAATTTATTTATSTTATSTGADPGGDRGGVGGGLEVRIMPNRLGLHAGLAGSFSILGFPHPDDPPIVHVETATQDLYLDDAGDLARYEAIYRDLQERALDPEASLAHLNALIARSEGRAESRTEHQDTTAFVPAARDS